jgi:hypothetical protein
MHSVKQTHLVKQMGSVAVEVVPRMELQVEVFHRQVRLL